VAMVAVLIRKAEESRSIIEVLRLACSISDETEGGDMGGDFTSGSGPSTKCLRRDAAAFLWTCAAISRV